MSEPFSVGLFRTSLRQQIEKIGKLKGAPEYVKVHVVNAAEVIVAYDDLQTALTLATQRAEAAEAQRDALTKQLSAEEQWLRGLLADYRVSYDDHTVGRHLALCEFIYELRAERDALRKVDDAMVGRFMVGYEVAYRDGNTHRFSIRAALDAALAVQTTTCTHIWVDARNTIVLSGEYCQNCGAVRPSVVAL